MEPAQEPGPGPAPEPAPEAQPQTQPQTQPNGVIEVLDVGDTPRARADAVRTFLRNISHIGVVSRRVGRVPEGPEAERRLRTIRLSLDWMEASLEMTPTLRDQTNLRRGLAVTWSNRDAHFPDDVVARARALHDRWEAENWGASATVEVEDEEANDDAGDNAAGGGGDEAPLPTAQVALPAPDDPVFGEGGLLHGIVRRRGPRGGVTYIRNPTLPKINCKVYGHNNIEPGTWYPLQIVALARGAHGARIAGIAGDTDLGAYSIVVSSSGFYDALDRDEGRCLFYSGSGSHENEDPDRPAKSTSGTKALKASLATGRPVRVLRAGNPGNNESHPWAPERGIRYDGLYRVVRMLTPLNARGGMYEQFELEREPGQRSLSEIRRTSPTPAQLFAWASFQLGN